MAQVPLIMLGSGLRGMFFSLFFPSIFSFSFFFFSLLSLFFHLLSHLGTFMGNVLFWFGIVFGPPLISILYTREYYLIRMGLGLMELGRVEVIVCVFVIVDS
jgi:hypothetical protein